MRKFAICFSLICLAVAAPAFAQDYQQLRDAILQQQKETRTEIQQINDAIDQYERQLNSAQRKYEEIYKQYENLKRTLALHEQKINTLQKERDQINEEISVTKKKLDQQQQKLEQLVEDYKKTLRYLYKNGQTSQLALILSSDSINQMMVRNYYLKKFENYREGQAAEIKETQKQLKLTEQELDSAATHNKKVMAEIEQEKKELQEKTKQQEANVKLLRQDREQIQKKLAQTREQKEELDNTLSSLISREEKIRQEEEERRRKQAAANSSDSASSPETEPVPPKAEAAASTDFVGRVGYVSDAELDEIEASFAKLKGDLPWPVGSHTVSEHFGRHRNPVYGTLTPNLGIEIVTEPHQEVHVVHAGYVFAVRPITGYGDVVFVSHGNYKTAYGNLSKVMVRKNTILKEGDIVGYSGDKNSVRGASVFFMLRFGSQNLDPEDWLK